MANTFYYVAFCNKHDDAYFVQPLDVERITRGEAILALEGKTVWDQRPPNHPDAQYVCTLHGNIAMYNKTYLFGSDRALTTSEAKDAFLSIPQQDLPTYRYRGNLNDLT